MIGFLAPKDEPIKRHLLPCPFQRPLPLLDANSDIEEDPDPYIDDVFPPDVICHQ